LVDIVISALQNVGGIHRAYASSYSYDLADALMKAPRSTLHTII